MATKYVEKHTRRACAANKYTPHPHPHARKHNPTQEHLPLFRQRCSEVTYLLVALRDIGRHARNACKLLIKAHLHVLLCNP